MITEIIRAIYTCCNNVPLQVSCDNFESDGGVQKHLFVHDCKLIDSVLNVIRVICPSLHFCTAMARPPS